MLGPRPEMSSVRTQMDVCLLGLLLAGCCVTSERSVESSSNGREKVATGTTFKIGALFDVRARHLTDTFHTALDSHNKGYLQHDVDNDDTAASPCGKNDVIRVILEPVISYVDVTDSFAVSNAMCDLIAHNVIAIVGVTNASSLPTIQSYSATFHVPFLSLGSAQNVTSSAPFQLSVRPPLMAAVVDLVQHQGCSSALYMYDSDEGLMRIQDLFQAINIRELYMELDVRRVSDKGTDSEISKIIGSLHPRREICLVVDLDRLDVVSVISSFDDTLTSIRDVIIVTMDTEMLLTALLHHGSKDRLMGFRSFNVSGLQLVPPLWHSSQTFPDRYSENDPVFSTLFERTEDDPFDHFSTSEVKSFTKINQYLANSKPPEPERPDEKGSSTEDHQEVRSKNQLSDSVLNAPDGKSQALVLGRSRDPKPEPKRYRQGWVSSSEALIIDCLKVLSTALVDLWEALGVLILDGNDVTQEDLSIKCTNFVVEKKQYGADLMESLRLIHIHGETRYISFDTSGKREDYGLSVFTLRAGSRSIVHEGEWSSTSGMTSYYGSRDGMKSYTIFGNMTNSLGRKFLIGFTE